MMSTKRSALLSQRRGGLRGGLQTSALKQSHAPLGPIEEQIEKATQLNKELGSLAGLLEERLSPVLATFGVLSQGQDSTLDAGDAGEAPDPRPKIALALEALNQDTQTSVQLLRGILDRVHI